MTCGPVFVANNSMYCACGMRTSHSVEWMSLGSSVTLLVKWKEEQLLWQWFNRFVVEELPQWQTIACKHFYFPKWKYEGVALSTGYKRIWVISQHTSIISLVLKRNCDTFGIVISGKHLPLLTFQFNRSWLMIKSRSTASAPLIHQDWSM